MSVLRRPIITEKMSFLTEQKDLPHYGFEVDMKADKDQIKRAVEKLYEVEVEKVRTMIVRGKQRMRYSKRGVVRGKSSNYKKAIVILKPGNEIDFFKHI